MLRKLTDRVYHMPLSVETDRPHLGLVCGSECSVIIDSGNSPRHAREFLKEVEALGVPPVKFVVLTHWHWDHVFGIKEMGITTIAHTKTKAKLEELQSMKWDDEALDGYMQDKVFNEFTVSCIKTEIPDRSGFTVGGLNITYEEGMEIDLGGVTCVIKAVGGDHTEDSTIVYVPEEKVMFLGDCIYGSRYNGVYGYTRERLFPMIEEIEKYKAEHYLVSHEEVFDRAGIEALWSQLKNAGEAVGDSISNEEAVEAFFKRYSRVPTEDESAYIQLFVNVNKALGKQ